ncbi:MAG: Tm-1-like ATP-binding domain-containing protein [Caldilineaceae bacterium]|nr:Tm-1-like ATP-binding domain-containing protein [Caldilineaceae bacterium]MDE0631147.1 Tm-1-like ATP-binding domain-containing protein [Caldilineaceae bacterium]
MSGTVLLVGALDTKGAEYAFVKDLIEAAGLQTLVVDFGVMGQPAFEPDVSRAEVAIAGGGDLAYLASGTRKDEAMRTMAQGLASVVERLYGEGRFDGILGMGGSGGTSIATSAMRTLPVGVPKVMVSTVGGGDVSAYAGSKDITFMPSVVDVAGINRLSRAIYANAAGAIAGMVKTEAEATADERPLIAASMFGNTTAAVDHARGLLEAEGFEVLVFHATGSGGRTMEDLISDGYIAGCLDMTTTELADEICDGVFSAGPDRVQAAPRQGVPTVIVPGCVDMANFGGIETVPDHYRERTLYEWNPEVTLLRTNEEENRQMGAMLAAAANAGQAGKVSVLVPLGGVSMLDSEGDRFWDPGADQACYDALKNDLRADIPLIEMDANINDPEFAEKSVALLLEMLREES